jgi:hypothetical protein
MEVVKKNLFSIICGVIAVMAVGALFGRSVVCMPVCSRSSTRGYSQQQSGFAGERPPHDASICRRTKPPQNLWRSFRMIR